MIANIMTTIYRPPSGNEFTLCGVRFFDLIFIEELAKHFKCFANTDGKIRGVCTRYALEIVRHLECFYYQDMENEALKAIFYNIFVNRNKVTELKKISFKARLIARIGKNKFW